MTFAARCACGLAAALLFAAAAAAAPAEAKAPDADPPPIWTGDFDGAREAAALEGRGIVLFFNGTDWCSWSMRLDHAISMTWDPDRAIAKRFVLVRLDYPSDETLPDPQIRGRNARLLREYGVRSFPTILVTDSSGAPLARLTARQGLYRELDALDGTLRRRDDILARAATASGLARARLLDEALSLLDPDIVARFHGSTVDEILAADPANQAGLKAKYELDRRIAEADSSMDAGNPRAAVRQYDAVIADLRPTGAQLQDILWRKAVAHHLIQDSDGEEASLERALAANPGNANMARRIQRAIDRSFPDQATMAHPGSVVTSLRPYEENVPERAYDGQSSVSYFWSDAPPAVDDHVTLILDSPGEFQNVRVLTGDPAHPDDFLHEGVLEVSADGKEFSKVGDFEDGVAEAGLSGRTVKAIRLRATAPQDSWLIVREFELE